MLTVLGLVFLVGWVGVSIIGTQAYFRGEQTKPIHERNWRSESFEQIAKVVTGKETDFADRVPAYSGDAYSSGLLTDK